MKRCRPILLLACFLIVSPAIVLPRPGLAQVPEPPSTIVLQFPNNPISDVLAVYEKLTGKSVVKDSEIFEGDTLSLVTPGEVSREEAIRLIESTLRLNDYALSYDLNNNTVRVMPEDTSQADVNTGLSVYDSPADVPDNETLIGYFMRLEHLDPVEAGSIFYNHVGLNRFGRITPVLNPSGLLITESSSMVRQLIRLREVVDVPHQKSKQITEFVELEYAEATIIAQIIQATLSSRPGAPRVGETTFSSGGTLSSQRSSERSLPQVVADDRLNRIMIVAMPDDHKYIRSLIDEWDKPIEIDSENTLERPLKYLFVDEALPVLVDILQDTGVGTAPLPGGGTITTRQTPQASTQASTLTGRLRRGVEVRDVQGGSVQASPDRLVQPLDNTAPLSVSIGKTRLVADLQANSIIAMGPKESLRKISDLLDKLDRKPPQVYLATVIGQLTLGDDFRLGVEYLQRFREAADNPILRGGSASLVDRESLRTAIGDSRDNLLTRGVEAATGLNLYGRVGESLDVFINALQQTDRFQVLSRPSIYAANNKKAVITSGERVPVPTSSLTDLDAGRASVRTNIDYEDVVLKLEVVPLINSDKEVTLTIAQVNDTVVGEQQVAENLVPVIGTEVLTTTVTIPNRHTVVLGGLITESETDVDRGIPFISRIPVVGHAFRTTVRDKTRKELMVFIQPTVVEDDDSLAEASYREDARTQIGSTAAQVFPESPLPLQPEVEPSEMAKQASVPEEPSREAEQTEKKRKRFGGFLSRFRSPSR